MTSSVKVCPSVRGSPAPRRDHARPHEPRPCRLRDVHGDRDELGFSLRHLLEPLVDESAEFVRGRALRLLEPVLGRLHRPGLLQELGGQRGVLHRQGAVPHALLDGNGRHAGLACLDRPGEIQQQPCIGRHDPVSGGVLHDRGTARQADGAVALEPQQVARDGDPQVDVGGGIDGEAAFALRVRRRFEAPAIGLDHDYNISLTHARDNPRTRVHVLRDLRAGSSPPPTAHLDRQTTQPTRTARLRAAPSL